ncbi:MAG TPA: hypothetical protein VFC07_11580 [Verrucomicrobiae bacterium]|nr:hypothetical protein [Verrucomicrobiae bacterium]
MAIAIFRAREPRYQGRTLTEWIKVGDDAYSAFTAHLVGYPYNELEADPGWKASSHAVRQMGTKAIPFLLNCAHATDSPQKAKVIEWLEEHPSLHFHIRSAFDRQGIAAFGFWLLGDDAKAAWPGLVQLTYDKNPELRTWALHHLTYCHPDDEIILPVLTRLSQDPDTNVEGYAAFIFDGWNPVQAESSGVYKRHPELRPSHIGEIKTNQPLAK